MSLHLVRLLTICFGLSAASAASAPPITFSEQVAPILFQNCTPCHRPGRVAPFVLQSYADAAGHAEKIAAAVASRRMPPWQADPFCGPFANARLLTTNEIQMIQQWVAEGAPEGDPKRLPARPAFNDGWELGPPDLVVPVTKPYPLAPSTNDTYYNLVLPLKLDRPRYVRAVEFSPGKAGMVHHAFLRFDRSGRCRQEAAANGGGFPGIHLPSGAFSSDSQFLSWQPGRRASEAPAGMSWQLAPGTDLILQLHLPASSIPAEVAPSVAFYFTDTPPTRRGYKVRLTSFTFEIPPGATNYIVREEIAVPIATKVVSILPHAHRLAKSVRVTVTPPGSAPRTLLDIPRWDFDWQTDYNLQPELAISAGSKLAVEFAYENPTARAVSYGPNTSDEMAELWILLSINSPEEYNALAKAESPLVIRDTIAYNRYRLRADPKDWRARLQIANAYLTTRDAQAALAELERAEAIAPNETEPHYWAGFALRQLNRVEEAESRFYAALRCDPKNWQAHGTLGLIFLGRRDYEEAANRFRNALAINPRDRLARQGLAQAEAALRKR
jgi:hypothetical protein